MKKLLKKKKSKVKQNNKEEELPIINVKKACPVCEGNVRGNTKILFYCKPCNILYRKKDLKSPHQSSKE